MEIIQSIQNRIYEIRGERVMLDFDLAALYEVPTKALNQAVKRNVKRFPEDFMFRLTTAEWQAVRSQIVTASQPQSLKLQNFITSQKFKRNSSVTPYAFTEQGVAMLSGILNSDWAAKLLSFPYWGKAGMGAAGLCGRTSGVASAKRPAGAVATN